MSNETENNKADRRYMQHLATILERAQGVTGDDGYTVDVGYQVSKLREHCDSAADEIERLRRENKKLHDAAAYIRAEAVEGAIQYAQKPTSPAWRSFCYVPDLEHYAQSLREREESCSGS